MNNPTAVNSNVVECNTCRFPVEVTRAYDETILGFVYASIATCNHCGTTFEIIMYETIGGTFKLLTGATVKQ